MHIWIKEKNIKYLINNQIHNISAVSDSLLHKWVTVWSFILGWKIYFKFLFFFFSNFLWWRTARKESVRFFLPESDLIFFSLFCLLRYLWEIKFSNFSCVVMLQVLQGFHASWCDVVYRCSLHLHFLMTSTC
jgi:hypothetical protein